LPLKHTSSMSINACVVGFWAAVVVASSLIWTASATELLAASVGCARRVLIATPEHGAVRRGTAVSAEMSAPRIVLTL